ncbi:hypothetical protein TrCOL_g8681 [Triparma columacea]|uniref:Ribosomal RNA small subunit methyltransferase G n=1 Tax=Triparma columacea TaxID=722753 RepID=A0A9W7LCH5_9STRA|nr:hypothetical protein TrCOL_g8681 [Triparma columacea]
MADLILDWNTKINLISRNPPPTKDHVLNRHILPSVALLNTNLLPSPLSPTSSIKVADVGTGGGFPGLPLAISCPESDFTLIDSVNKKLVAVKSMADTLGLKNVRVHHGRAEEMKLAPSDRFDLILGRSVSSLPNFCSWVSPLLSPSGKLLYIKGGDLGEETRVEPRARVPISTLAGIPDVSDKDALLFTYDDVKRIAGEFKPK